MKSRRTLMKKSSKKLSTRPKSKKARKAKKSTHTKKIIKAESPEPVSILKSSARRSCSSKSVSKKSVTFSRRKRIRMISPRKESKREKDGRSPHRSRSSREERRKKRRHRSRSNSKSRSSRTGKNVRSRSKVKSRLVELAQQVHKTASGNEVFVDGNGRTRYSNGRYVAKRKIIGPLNRADTSSARNKDTSSIEAPTEP